MSTTVMVDTKNKRRHDNVSFLFSGRVCAQINDMTLFCKLEVLSKESSFLHFLLYLDKLYAE